ncbi:hypothetical protein [Cognataquiflexum rubidum]|uniref:hypothetical protein n=1 Tax=Cognataquiflexum rubidum TaxID=2922273 RepID=UPI001F146956|nr:hypothetical protein [Cognataquiflexum rubidum]MCH6235076.1 hypothetical protein [Cognataquiflexum rubidum]
MLNPTTHKILILTGYLIWCASFFGEALGGQPYSTIGIVISPVLTVIGVFYWFKYYHTKRGHYPKFEILGNNIVHAGGSLTLRFDFLLKHILKFWTFCILFWMGLVLIVLLTFGRSEAFEATKQYCQSNQEILSQTGPIKYFGLLLGVNMSTDEQGDKAEFSFTIVGTKGNFIADSKLIKKSGVWTVENLEFR